MADKVGQAMVEGCRGSAVGKNQGFETKQPIRDLGLAFQIIDRWCYLFGEQFSDQNAANTAANVATASGI